MDHIMDVLWPMTRIAFDLPEKPLWGTACNRCGLCCLVETCPLGLLFFGPAKSPCPALKLDGGQSACQLIADPAALLPPLIAADAGEMARLMLGSGEGCDSEMTEADNAACDARPDWPRGPTKAERARVEQLLDGIAAKLESA